jgi:hypothetical protein
VIRIIDTILQNGSKQQLAVNDMSIVGRQLHVVHTPPTQGDSPPPGSHVIFEISQPTLAQVGGQVAAEIVHTDGHSIAAQSSTQIAVLASQTPLVLRDVTNSRNVIELGRYDGRGFDIPGVGFNIDASTTLASTLHSERFAQL